MGVDEDLVTIVRDLVEFLEKLCDAVELPSALENVRYDLLRRSKTSMEVHFSNSTSPEPYLEMKPGKGKGLIIPKLGTLDDANLTEYIDADNQITATSPQSDAALRQNEYESFGNAPVSTSLGGEAKDEAEEQLKSIYRSFTAEQTKSKCHKCGPLLQLKDERSIFMKTVQRERSCWVGLVGTYFLTYANKDAKQPKEIFSIRGFSARLAQSLITDESDRSKSVFEVFCPGSKTLQFIARSPKDMEQWVATVNRVGSSSGDKSSTEVPGSLFEQLIPSLRPNSVHSEEQYQDIGEMSESLKKPETSKSPAGAKEIEISEKISQEKSTKTATKPSPLNTSSPPPPLPARIPRRLPSLPQTPITALPDPIDITDERDDLYYTIEDMKDKMTYMNLKLPSSPKNFEPNDSQKAELEVYDDIQGTPSIKSPEEKLETYDEVGASETKKKESARDSPKKRSFFNRFKGQKESPKKEDSKRKEKAQNAAELAKCLNQELPTYDDVLQISVERKEENGEEQENYTCPPAPRPVHLGPPVKIEEEIYDDIGHVRETEQVESSLNNDNCEVEHYQVPRAQDPIDPGQLAVTNEEDLYDDVAILAEFRARQRDSASSSSSSEKTVNNVAKAWSRFASGKRSDKNGLKKNSDENGENCIDSGEDGSDSKLNKFHKLKSKMEHALNITGKPPIPPMSNKCDGH